MRLGLLLPQGYFNEFDGWRPDRAWARVVEVAREAERRGFDSVWLGEHVLAKWNDAETAFDCVTLAAAIAAAVPRVEIGFTVVNSTFRNPAMTAKMGATLQYLTGGRFIMGIGAGWKEDEYRAYGYDYPAAGVRIDQLEEAVQIIRAMWTQSQATF